MARGKVIDDCENFSKKKHSSVISSVSSSSVQHRVREMKGEGCKEEEEEEKLGFVNSASFSLWQP